MKFTADVDAFIRKWTLPLIKADLFEHDELLEAYILIVPFGDRYQDPYAMLAAIAERGNIEQLAIVTYDAEGTPSVGHFKMTRERLAHAALVLQREALMDDEV